MLESRWLHLVGPGVVAVALLGAIVSTTLGVGGPPWVPRPCAGVAADRVSAARDAGATGPADVAAVAASAAVTPPFRLDPVLGPDGALLGQRLAVLLEGEPGGRTLELPPESFAAGAFGHLILVGSDDGTTSRLEAIDTTKGCIWPIAQETAVIRRATIDPARALIYETRVERVGRVDLGVWGRPIDGTSPARRVLAPLAADARFGRTFSTEFTWDTAGRRLAVQACGELACRIRIVEPDGGPAATLETPELGPLVGLDGDRVVTYGACRGLPCPIVVTNLRTGRREVLAQDGGPAVLLTTPDGARVVHEIFDATGRRLRAVALDGRAPTDLGPVPDGLRLRTAADGVSTVRLPSGWVLLAPDSPRTGDDAALRPQLRHIPDGMSVLHDEAAR